MSTRSLRTSRRLPAFLLLLVALAGAHSTRAQNENETVGFQTNHLFESGAFGENIDILNGGLSLTIPIGQRYQVTPDLGYGLQLSYGSKIWRADGVSGANRLVRQGPFGLGFNLHLGRLYRDVAAAGGGAATCTWYYVSPDGNEHPFRDDSPSLPCDAWPLYTTTDTTYFSVNPPAAPPSWDGAPSTAPTMIIHRDGVIYEFGHLVQVYEPGAPPHPLNHNTTFTGMGDATTRYNQDFGGWYVTKIWTMRADEADHYVNITYDSRVGYEHVISTISDNLGRVMTFTNTCEPAATPSGCVETPVGPNAPNRAAVRTTAITVPAFGGATAVYNFTYDWHTVESAFTTQPESTYGPVNLLIRIDYPEVTNHAGVAARYQMAFDYEYQLLPSDPIRGGELRERTLPTGATTYYEWSSYRYISTTVASARPSVMSEARQITRKTTVPGQGLPDAVWVYTRDAGAGGTFHTNPYLVVVTDPTGNDTKYYYHASRTASGLVENPPAMNPEDDWAPEWNDGMAYLVEYYQGTGSAARLIRTDSEWYDADASTYGGRDKKNIRSNRKVTTHIDDSSRTSTTAYQFWDGMGHYKEEVASGDGIASQRTTRTEYLGYDPGRYLYREVSEEGRVVSRTENQYDTSGRVTLSVGRMTLPITPNGPTLPISVGDVVTRFYYDAAGRVILKEVGDQGIDGNGVPLSPKYRVQYGWQAGGYLATKEFTDWETGTFYPWKAIDRSRDSNTGLILASQDTAGQTTAYDYDALGRITDITPPGAEHPTQIEYVDVLNTTVRQGDPVVMGSDYTCNGGVGDYVMTCYEYDTLGRLTLTKKRPYDVGLGYPYQKSEYNVVGWKTFDSEWLWPGDTVVGTTYSYTDPHDPSQVDPFGRVRKVTTADQKVTETSYNGMNSTMKVTGIASPTGTLFEATTVYERDPWGRLVGVYAPVPGTGETEAYRYGGGDAFYSYDARDNLIAVEVVDRTTLFRQVRSFEYDPLNRLRSAYQPESGTQAVTGYDPLGNATETVDASGNKLITTYDGAGRIVSVSRQEYQKPGWSLPPAVVLFEHIYDDVGTPEEFSKGRLRSTASRDENGLWVHTLERRYDHASGRVTRELSFYDGWSQTEAVPLTYSYNAFGLVDTLTYPEGPLGKGGAFSLTYEYSNGLPIEVWDPTQTSQPQAAVTYNAAGGIKTVVTFGQVRTLIDPDTRNRPELIDVARWNGQAFADYLFQSGTYGYDGAGNISQIGENSYGYDAANRLLRAVTKYQGTIRKQTFLYDDFGNMTQKDLYDAVDTLVQRDIYTVTHPTSGYNDNRLLSHEVGAAWSTFSYDARGNTLRGDGRMYDIDSLNRVLNVWSTNGSTRTDVARYLYDASSNRVRKQDAARDLLTFYVRDGQGRLMSEFRRSGSGAYVPEWVKHQIYLGDRLVGLRENIVPAPPGKVTATINRPQRKVILSWVAAVQGEGYTVTSYKVYRRPNSGSTAWEHLGTSTATTYTDSTVTNNTVYQYLVTAIDSLERQSYGTGTLVVLAGDIMLPNPPTGLAGVAGDQRADLSWPPNLPAELVVGYHVYRATGTGSPAKITVAPVSRLAYRDQDLINGTTYRYSISAVDSATNESIRSSEVIVVPQDYTPPDAPRRVRATADCAGGTAVTLSWEASQSTEPVDYAVFRSPAYPGGSTSALALTNFFVDVQADPGTAYTYTVKTIDANQNLSIASAPETVVTRALPSVLAPPGAPPVVAAKDGQVAISATLGGGQAVRVYRKANVEQSCHGYELVGDLPWTGRLEDTAVTNGMAWDYALTQVDENGIESQFSVTALAMPVARPQGVTRCIEELPAWADGAIMCPQYGTPRTPWRRFVLRWADPPSEPYQPYGEHSDGSLGFLKGVRLYRYQHDYGTSMSDNSTLSPVLDEYMKKYCTLLPDKVCVNAATDCPSGPGSDCVATYSSVGYASAYGQCSNSSEHCMMDDDCGVGHQCNYELPDPTLLMFGDTRYNGKFQVTDSGFTCMSARAVYRVFANGTWMTVESDLGDNLSRADTAEPLNRCAENWPDVCSADLRPDAFAPAPNGLICPAASVMPPVPPAPTVTTPSSGVMQVAWAKPKKGLCELAPTAPSCAYTACEDPNHYCAVSDGYKCRLSNPLACDTDSECSGTPGAVCRFNQDADIRAWRLYVTEVDGDRHHFVRVAPVVLTFDAAITSHTIAGVSKYLWYDRPAQFIFRVASVDRQGRVSEPSAPSPTITPTEPDVTVKPPASLKAILWTTNDAGRDKRGVASYAHPRDIDGIKLAWKDALTYPLAGVLGYRVWRQLPDETWCALLKPGTPEDPNPPGVPVCTNELTSLLGDPNAYSTQYTTGPTGGNRVYIDKTVPAGAQRSYSVSVITTTGESAKSERIDAMALPHPTQALSPPSYFQAAAPYTGSERRGVYLTWCKNHVLEGVTKYRIYRSTGVANRLGPFTFLAEVDTTCLDSGKRCQINTVGASITPSGSCTPGIGGTCEIVDRTVGQPQYGSGYAAQVKDYTYNYAVRAVRDLGGGNFQESPYSVVNSGWPNYCTTGELSCEPRYDPDNSRPIPCGDETTSLDGPESAPHQDSAIACLPDDAESATAVAPYRVIGQTVSLPSMPDAVVRFLYYHVDHLGSPRVITDAVGNEVSKHHYMPFGEEMPWVAQGSTSKKQFTGHERDTETGADYMLARYYSSSLGRFMAVDPGDDTALEDPQSWNKYAYVRNNPLKAVDPDGQEQTVITGGKTYMGGVDGESSGNEQAKWQVFKTLVAVTLAFAGAVEALAEAVPQLDAPTDVPSGAPDAPADEGAPQRSLDDPGSLEGASTDELRELTPGWDESPTRTDGGIRRSNPERQGEQVRHMPGNPDDPDPRKQGPYIRVSKDGKKSEPVPARPPKPEEKK